MDHLQSSMKVYIHFVSVCQYYYCGVCHTNHDAEPQELDI